MVIMITVYLFTKQNDSAMMHDEQSFFITSRLVSAKAIELKFQKREQMFRLAGIIFHFIQGIKFIHLFIMFRKIKINRITKGIHRKNKVPFGVAKAYDKCLPTCSKQSADSDVLIKVKVWHRLATKMESHQEDPPPPC